MLHEIKASPTKEFFISMLVKDVTLTRSIIDVVDNSVDGATRTAVGQDFSSFDIKIEITPECFRITDNCGGIPVEIAESYAFRFGRPSDAGSTENSIGNFGVGMKRTIFKLGRRFCVKSSTKTSRFSVQEDVESWVKRPDDWTFSFSSREANISVPESDVGTVVEISNLHENVKEDFAKHTFISELRSAIEEAHALKISSGLRIRLNNVPLGVEEFKLLRSDLIAPAYVKIEVPPTANSRHPLFVDIFAGIGERSLEKGGWYIFCNGRQVLAADQSTTTGWATVIESELEDKGDETIRKYHADFAYFRGFVFFECADANQLPWTTTKTGVDTDSKVYRLARREMQRLMRPIVKFLSGLATETGEKNKDPSIDTPLREAITAAKPVNFAEVKVSEQFVSPQPQVRRNRRMDSPFVNIQYKKEKIQVEIVKERLGLTSASDVGSATFDYFFKTECE